MAAEFVSYVRPDVEGDPDQARELAEVRSVAERLRAYLDSPGVGLRLGEKITRSQDVQDALMPGASELGFVNESKGLFAGCKTPGLRPDYFRAMGRTGILLEVEWGKTVKNNMDLLDFWKCHICRHAHYLILLVPTHLRQNPTMSPRNEFASVSKRLSSFFEEDNYTNVRGLFLFGY